MDKKAVFTFLFALLAFSLASQDLFGQWDTLRHRQHWDQSGPQPRIRIKNAPFPKDSSAAIRHRNELGVDVTTLIMQVLHLTEPQFGGFNGTPEYYLTYRRYFKPGNIRSAIGGNYLQTPINNTQIDTGDYFMVRRALAFRVGWEFCSELSKRWQAFYGVDVLFAGSYFRNDWTFSNGGYQNGRIDILNSIGLGPILGFRFRLNPRLSIATETRFSLHRNQQYEREFSVPIVNPLPLIPDEISDITSWQTRFTPPTSLFFTFSF